MSAFNFFSPAFRQRRQYDGGEVQRDEQSRQGNGRNDGHGSVHPIPFAKFHIFSLRLIRPAKFGRQVSIEDWWSLSRGVETGQKS